MKNPKNPSAFPTQKKDLNEGLEWTEDGMSLRDYFAAKAMQGVLSIDVDLDCPPKHIASWSYEIADAMLAERNSPIDDKT